MIQTAHKKDVTNVTPLYDQERQNLSDIKKGISEKRKHTKKLLSMSMAWKIWTNQKLKAKMKFSINHSNKHLSSDCTTKRKRANHK